MGNQPDYIKNIRSVVKNVVVNYWPLWVLGALFVVINWRPLGRWWSVWTEHYSYYSHGPLVPVIVGYMIWNNRRRLAKARIQPSKFGYVLLAVAGALHVLGNWMEANTLQGAAFIIMIFAVLFLLSVRIARILVVPVLFLLSMIPMAQAVLDGATAQAQLYSAAIAAKFIQLSGYSASLQGATIYSPTLPEPLVVGAPCSGLRTLISLITFTVFFVYLVRAQWWKKGVLLVMSFPLSMFINSLRITMIGYAGFWTGSADAMHKFHDYSGYIGLVICFALLFGIAKLLKVDQIGFTESSLSSEGLSAWDLSKAKVSLSVAFVVMALVGLSSIGASPICPQTKGKITRENIPMHFGKWTAQKLPIDDVVKDTLKKGDLLSRVYWDNSEYSRQVHLFVTAARDPEAFHDPHVCLPGGGSTISSDRTITLHFDKPRPMTVKATRLETKSDYSETLVIYWYMMGPDSIARTSEVWDRNRMNLIHDAVRLASNPGSGDSLRNEIENRQFVWYRFTTEVIYGTDKDEQALIEFIKEFVANVEGFGE